MPYVLSDNYTQLTASGTLTKPTGLAAGDLSVVIVHMVGSTSLGYSMQQGGETIYSLTNGWDAIDPGSFTLVSGRRGQHVVAYKVSTGTDNPITLTLSGQTGSPAAARATWLYFQLVDEPAPTDEVTGYVWQYTAPSTPIASPASLTGISWAGGLTADAPCFEFGIVSVSSGAITATPTDWEDVTGSLVLANSAQGDVAVVYRYRTTTYDDPDEVAFSGSPVLVTASLAGLGPISAPEEPLVPPVAVITASNLTLQPGMSSTFYGTDSTDADGTIVEYAWEIEQPSPAATLTGSDDSITASFSAVGTYTITLTVTDNDGLSDTTTATVTVTYATVTEAMAGQPVLIRRE